MEGYNHGWNYRQNLVWPVWPQYEETETFNADEMFLI